LAGSGLDIVFENQRISRAIALKIARKLAKFARLRRLLEARAKSK
jgi:hypothetical protein